MSLNVNKLLMAMEGIAFQPNSKLSKDLIDIFSDLKKYPENIKINPRTQFNDVFYDTLEYFEKTTVPKLQKCIRTHTGIILEKVYCREFYPPKIPLVTFDFFIACVKPNQDPKKLTASKWWVDALDVISGSMSKEAHVKAESADQMIKILQNFDNEIGSFKISEDLDELITVHMGLDLGSMCFTDKILHERLLPLTAEEITAIVLHELGHILSTVSYLKYAHYSIETLKGSFEHFIKYAKPEEASKFIQSEFLLNLSKQITNPLTKTTFEKCRAITAKLDTYLVPTQTGYTANTIMVIIIQLIHMIKYTILNIMLLPFYQLLKLLTYALYNANLRDSDKGPKQSDLKVFNIQLHEAERIADEFVVKHNMGSYQQEALKKLYDGVTFIRGSAGDVYGNKTSNVLFHMVNFFGLCEELMSDLTYGTVGVHPETPERADTIARMQVQNIRQSENNTFKLSLAIKEYERAFSNSKNKSNRDKWKVRIEKLNGILDNITGIISLGVISFQQESQVDALIKSALALMDNDIYVSAIKLKVMLDNMKKKN